MNGPDDELDAETIALWLFLLPFAVLTIAAAFISAGGDPDEAEEQLEAAFVSEDGHQWPKVRALAVATWAVLLGAWYGVALWIL